MTLAGRLSRLAVRLERGLERLRRRRPPDSPPMVDPYIGYGVPGGIVLRGRVLTSLRRAAPRPEQGRLTNLRQMLRLFMTDEVAGVLVEARGRRALSDEEGYFHLTVPRQPDEAGWIRVPVSQLGHADPESGAPAPWAAAEAEPDAAVLPAFLPDGAAVLGVISDIDDTMLETGAWRPLRMLWTSLTGNILTRRIFPDAVTLIDRLTEDGRTPVFYVSSSPWNLHEFLYRLFDRHGLRQGPMFLRDLGIAEDKLIVAGHGDHKSRAIDAVLTANPDLPFVLVGDTGQADAEIYEAATRRHPGRIVRVILRAPGRGADAADLVHIRRLRDRAIPVHVGADFSAALEALAKEA